LNLNEKFDGNSELIIFTNDCNYVNGPLGGVDTGTGAKKS
jgi:hypothetical protein